MLLICRKFQVNSVAQLEADRRLARRLVQLMFWPARLSTIQPQPQETLFTRPESGHSQPSGSTTTLNGHNDDDETSVAAADPFDPSPIIQRVLGGKADRKEKPAEARNAGDLDTSYISISSVQSVYLSSPGSVSSPSAVGSPLRTYGNRKRKPDTPHQSAACGSSTPAKRPPLPTAVGHSSLAKKVATSGMMLPSPLPGAAFGAPVALRGLVPVSGAVPSRVVLLSRGASSPPVRLVPVSISHSSSAMNGGGALRQTTAVFPSSQGAVLASPFHSAVIAAPQRSVVTAPPLRAVVAGQPLQPAGLANPLPAAVIAPPPPSDRREVIHVFSRPEPGGHHPQAAPGGQRVQRFELSTENPLTKQLGNKLL